MKKNKKWHRNDPHPHPHCFAIVCLFQHVFSSSVESKKGRFPALIGYSDCSFGYGVAHGFLFYIILRQHISYSRLGLRFRHSFPWLRILFPLWLFSHVQTISHVSFLLLVPGHEHFFVEEPMLTSVTWFYRLCPLCKRGQSDLDWIINNYKDIIIIILI